MRGWHCRAVAATASVGLLATGLVAGTPALASAQTATTQITLLNINDFHGRIDGNTVRFAGTVERERANAPDGEANTLFLSAGDNIGASLFASSSQRDQPTIDVLNALALDSSAVGNHEFDTGFADLVERVIPAQDFPLLGANVYRKGTTTPAMETHSLHEVGGLTVGVIGAVTQLTPSLVSPGGIADLDFGDPVDAVNRVAAQLTDGNPDNGEADVLVAEYHDGAGASTADGSSAEQERAAGGVFTKIVDETSAQVDAIFTGHTHKEYAWSFPKPGGGTRPVVQTGSYGERLGKVVLTVSPTGDVVAHTQENVRRLAPTIPTGTSSTETARINREFDEALVAQYPRVAEVDRITRAAIAQAREIGQRQVGTVTADITTAFRGGGYTGPGDTYVGPDRDTRSQESTLGNLVANGLRDSLSDPLRGGATIGITNPGGLRAELLRGDDGGVITLAEANAVQPFANSLFTLTLTGAQLVTLLEQQWQTNAAGETITSAPYLQLGLSDNVSYTFDPTLPRGSRITSVTVDGRPLDLAAGYRIGTPSFLAQGGDNFRVFREGTDVRDSGLIDADAWYAYLEASSPITPSFARRAVEVRGFPASARTGSRVQFDVAQLDLTSLGSPRNTALTVTLGDRELGTVAVSGGAARVDLPLPLLTAGSYPLRVTAAPSGTTVLRQLVLTGFPDVPPGDVHDDAVSYLVERRIATGFTDGTFGPDRSITRAQAAAFLYRQANDGGQWPACSARPFSDVPQDDVFCGAIAWAAERGAVRGFADGTFGPAATITRGQMSSVLYREALGRSAPSACDGESAFRDVPRTDVHCAAVKYAADSRIAQGFPDGTFRPAAPVTRGQAAALLFRYATS